MQSPAGRWTGASAAAAQVTFSPRGPARVKFFQIDAGSLQAVQTHESSPVLAEGRAIEHLVSVDGDGAGGLIIGARLLRPEAAKGRNASLALTRLASAGDNGKAGDGNGRGLEAAGGPTTGSPAPRTSLRRHHPSGRFAVRLPGPAVRRGPGRPHTPTVG